MSTIFIVLVMSIWAGGEPEITQYGTSVLAQSYPSRSACEERLAEIADGENMIKEKGLRGILKMDVVYRHYDATGRVSKQYSCLEVNFKKTTN